ncbi:MAG: 3-hydroxyisobutyrate dehydrogenase [Coriobacteriales bacterium]|nr:3-hydroxyisobutyrate dehydrogenase [Coriobacteriales bacterium]MDO5710083.1 3-hydroxyisobutyrate dehydrogenase [Coriobacteriales bacterium]
MDKELFEYTAQRVEELLAAPSSSQETREAAQGWKDAIAAGADEDLATKVLLDILDRHHTTIDELIGFAEGPAKTLLGEEAAAGMLAHALEIKANGAKYCDCPACTASHELLSKHGRPVA